MTTTINATSVEHLVALAVPLLSGLGLSSYIAASPTVTAILTGVVTILGYFGIHAGMGNVTKL